MDMDLIPMVRVTWQDAQDSDGCWTLVEDIVNHELATCQDVGWMVHRDEDKLVLMRSRIVEEDPELKEGGGHIAIPNSWVIKVEQLQTVLV
jgi:hypothetical protein